VVGPPPPVNTILTPSALGIGGSDDIDALSIFDPGVLFPSTALTLTGTSLLLWNETAPLAGVNDPPSPTLWHAESQCGSSYSLAPPTTIFSSILGQPGTVTLLTGFGPTACGGPCSAPDDDASTTVSLPFPFTFFGQSKTQLRVSVNGFLSFGASLGCGSASNASIPSGAAPNDVVAPFWDDWRLGTPSAQIAYRAAGSGTNQTLTVEWFQLSPPGVSCFGSQFAALQAVLYQSGNAIEFHYNLPVPAQPPTGISGTVGIENAAGSGGFSVLPGSAVSSIPGTSYRLVSGSTFPPSFAGFAAAYNQGDLGNYTYNTGGINSGALVSEPFFVPPGTGNVELVFDYALQADGIFDTARVEARPQWTNATGGPPGWVPVYPLPLGILPAAPCATPTTVCIRALAPACPAGGVASPNSGLDDLIGQGGRIRFLFNTVTATANDFLGWYVDNVSLEIDQPWIVQTFGTGCPASGTGAPEISTTAVTPGGNPNPVSPNAGFGLQAQGFTPGGPVFFAIGGTNAAWGSLPLPAPLGFLGPGAASCTLYTDVGALLSVSANGSGQAILPLPIPSGAGGFTGFSQAFQATAPGGVLTIASTSGIMIRIR
ncbi:MAG: hypothetical protein ACREIU_02835, partial [Planctomycetota bacterium]